MSVDFEIDSALREACERGSRARAAKRQWCLEHIQCPNCGAGGLLIEQSAITCRSCRTFFPQETGALNFLTPELYDRCLLRHTDNVASNNYDELAARMIDDVLERGGKILDCGAGSRPEISEAVVNLEIVAYPSTDVLGVGQALPFRDASFDAIFSFAVLEHVSDPFRCAAEMVRVLKPGGKIYAHVPFLQPEHGYPNHFYNMTRQGVANLFRGLTVEQHFVPASGVPIWALHWMVEQYALQLSPSAKDRFLSMRIRDILAKRPIDYLEDPIVTELSTDGNWILASTTAIIATKQSTIQM